MQTSGGATFSTSAKLAAIHADKFATDEKLKFIFKLANHRNIPSKILTITHY